MKEINLGENVLSINEVELDFSNLPNLEQITIGKASLMKLKSLQISNNEKLRIITIKGGDDENTGVCCNTKAVILKSYIRLFSLHLDLPGLAGLRLGKYSFYNTEKFILKGKLYIVIIMKRSSKSKSIGITELLIKKYKRLFTRK